MFLQTGRRRRKRLCTAEGFDKGLSESAAAAKSQKHLNGGENEGGPREMWADLAVEVLEPGLSSVITEAKAIKRRPQVARWPEGVA